MGRFVFKCRVVVLLFGLVLRFICLDCCAAVVFPSCSTTPDLASDICEELLRRECFKVFLAFLLCSIKEA
jgi:hypothetical protein